ncbi:pyridoxamine 5'-phosphate oxidase family protein [Marivirga salinae]|uniref:Pyridoxamine 5'-phosphate oxidase family protein n=1 Tax=Marivirga salinarum TaxID=3059078 RepID=A0AA51N8W2_9BACT|nr:pyridoxamine 5'-phosphate oxidase family protein [Marivirga sp. BDSF4-3]WMN10986.1 pyridoxamine 5'-phosphate oxidase family protein [Marivirga sp. BDSF4-3]
MSLIELKDNLSDVKSTMLGALNQAGNDKRSAFRYIILNTISEGIPNTRYVVLRKFKTDSQELFIFTDYRSNKIREIKENPFASVLAYDQQNKCQIKLKGKINIHHQDEIADDLWDSVEDGQESYNTKSQPGKKVDSLNDAHQMKNDYDDKYFAVLIMKVSKAEILQLKGDGHIRAFLDFESDESSYLVP